MQWEHSPRIYYNDGYAAIVIMSSKTLIIHVRQNRGLDAIGKGLKYRLSVQPLIGERCLQSSQKRHESSWVVLEHK